MRVSSHDKYSRLSKEREFKPPNSPLFDTLYPYPVFHLRGVFSHTFPTISSNCVLVVGMKVKTKEGRKKGAALCSHLKRPFKFAPNHNKGVKTPERSCDVNREL